MNKQMVVLACGLMLAFTTQVAAQTTDSGSMKKSPDETDKAPSASPQNTPTPTPSSEQTGGDTTPNAVDPAHGDKTGANVGEGASYSRSKEKGDSTLSDQKK